jgi:hypothetical protein
VHRDVGEYGTFLTYSIVNDTPFCCLADLLITQLAEFNKVLFKKDVSPFKKWAFVEGLATFLKLANLMDLMSAYFSPLFKPGLA